ncbi:MAG: hypothetical protein QOD44_2375 [Solirubrobacteraceae bacterium]|nr:hypothetical protein [Solirubrobacteraceae bacterium]
MSGAPGPDEPARQRAGRRPPASRDRARGIARRAGSVWRRLTPEQRLAGIAATALLLSMLLPWYQETGFALVRGRQVSLDDTKNAFQVYSFVEAAIFVVSAGVIAILWARGERKAFHLPGGDGAVIAGGGLWVMFLIFYRQLDKPNGRSEGPIQTVVGVEWGIFVAFLLGGLLAYAGYRIRATHAPEPLADDVAPGARPAAPAPASPSAAYDRPDEQLWEDASTIAARAARERDRSEDTTVADRARRPRDPSDDTTVVDRARRPRDPSEDPTVADRPRGPRDPGEPLDGQLSFDEPAEYRPPPPRP